ncbi:MAG TPA: MarR family transcriptional regulator [Lachnospiraceae bacterium]|nr:MarR family transcriptional regulator [Lachnospiraceae bacterium]
MNDLVSLRLTKEPVNLSEELLNAWLSLSAVVRNERLVQTMTFREIFICNILHQEKSTGKKAVTATDIVSRTGMLKSQANKVLCSLEERKLICRTRCDTDKRQIHIQLTEVGRKMYLTEHQRILQLLSQLVHKMGTDTIDHFIKELNQAACVMKELTDKGNTKST